MEEIKNLSKNKHFKMMCSANKFFEHVPRTKLSQTKPGESKYTSMEIVMSKLAQAKSPGFLLNKVEDQNGRPKWKEDMTTKRTRRQPTLNKLQ